MTTSTGSSSAPRLDGRERLLTPAFLRLALADLAYFTAAGVAIYALPVYVTGPVGGDEAGAGLAFGAFAITALVLRPYAGRLSDTKGRRPLLVGGALVASAAMLLTAHAETLPTVIALRLSLGVAEAAFFVASFAALADLAPPSRIGEALSYNSLGLYLGLALGPLLGDFLVHSLGFTAAWYGAAVLLLVAARVAQGIGETRGPRPTAQAPAPLILWRAVPPAVGFLTSVIAMGGFLAFASLNAEAVGLAPISVTVALYGFVVVVCRIAFARVPDRLPALPLGATALSAIATGLITMAVWPSPLGALAGAALMGLGVTFSTPAFFSAVFATASPSERGAASGTASIAFDLGIGAGPILLGLVAQSAGIPAAFLVAAGIALAGSVWSAGLAGGVRRR